MPDTQYRDSSLDRAVALLGPLEGRIMRALWSGTLQTLNVVRDIQALMPELAYTTVMTTLNRLSDKGILDVHRDVPQKAHPYSVAVTPDEFLQRTSRDEVAQIVERFGEAAIAAFAERLDGLSAEQLAHLRKLGHR